MAAPKNWEKPPASTISHFRHARQIRQGLSVLTTGFLMAIVVTFLFSWAIRGPDRQPKAFEPGIRPVSALIDAPNLFSVVVAVLADIVGIRPLTQARPSALLGVFIRRPRITASQRAWVERHAQATGVGSRR
ncbi:DUF389 domain-containing protein [Streptomyces sp. NPDC057575]|uniref:DUF389 domain-containing protein n=1 Tax=unclassified Streptomyces TaxID=2593676 RepID=UPI0036BD9937